MLVFYGSLHPEVQAINFCFEVELQFLPGDSRWFIVLPRPAQCSLANLDSSQPFRSALLMLKVLYLIKVLSCCLYRREHCLVVRSLLLNKMIHVVPWLGNYIVTYPIQSACESIHRQKKTVDRLSNTKPLKFTNWKRLRNMMRTRSIPVYAFCCSVPSFSNGTQLVLLCNFEHLRVLGWKLFVWSLRHTLLLFCILNSES